MPPPEHLRFSRFVVDPTRRQLTAGGRPVALGDRAFSVLLQLLEQPGALLDKHELLASVWSDVVVTEDSLVQAISEIRSALGDDAREPRFVQTVHRRGYRFVAPVERPAPGAAAATRGAAATGRRAVAVAVAAAVLALGATLLWRSLSPPAEPPPPFGRVREIEGLPAGIIKPAYSPSGELLAAVLPDPGSDTHSLVLVKPGGGELLRLTGGIDVRGPSPVFSADGGAIYFTSYRADPGRGLVPDVWRVPVLGGAPELVLREASSAAPDHRDRRLAYAAVTASTTELRMRDASGAEIVLAPSGYWPRWSPDDRWIAYTTSNPEGGSGEVWIVAPDGSERRRLTTDPAQIYGLCWTADSRWLIYASDLLGAFDLWAVSVDGAHHRQLTSGPGADLSPTAAPDGDHLIFTYARGKGEVVLGSLQAADDVLVPVVGEAVWADLSPDGGRLALVVGSRAEEGSVWIRSLATGESRRTGLGLVARRVRWTSTGDRVLAAARGASDAAYWIWSVDAESAEAEPLLRGEADWDWPDLSPDGRRLAAVRRSRAGGSELVVTDLTSGKQRVLATGAEICGVRWSPDGRSIAWSGAPRPEAHAGAGVWVVAAAAGGSPPTRVACDGAFPVWLPGGDGLLFARYLEHAGVWRVGPGGGAVELVREKPYQLGDAAIEGLDLSADGGDLLVLTTRGTSSLYRLDGLAL